MRETLMSKGLGTKVLFLEAQQRLVEQEQQLIVGRAPLGGGCGRPGRAGKAAGGSRL